MPNGFWYASGPCRRDERPAGSAFSKGDMLALDANSSLSRLNPYAVAAGSLYGIATADSTDSIRGLCGCIVIQPNTYFWSATTSGVTLLTGEESGVSFDATKPGRYWVDESSTTNVVVVVEGTDRIDQSHQSKVIVQFKYADSELDLA
jgi:hypothetical protein